ncbi:hypothetical protein M0R45_012594 [Rubus argutus]|uniref:Dof zinc finger protein n=1 Tax=Rubus argutus TaxID=59490 RepID=A0AAW1YG25_RUBAR
MAEIKRPRVMGYPPPPSADQLPCPRCNSTVTKFCYYNNYNLAQPRHFCRSCRRYWTQGGALRDIPVGGGTRKSKAKRSRNHAAAAAGASSSTSPSSSSLTHETKPILDKSDEHLLNLNDDIAAATGGGFSSLMMMNSQEQPGFLSLGGYGYGYGYGSGLAHGFQQGFGYGTRAAGVWEFPPEGASINVVPAYSPGFNTWQMPGADHEAGQGGLVHDNGSHCFDWPELDISNCMPSAVNGKEANSSSTSSNPRLNSPAAT